MALSLGQILAQNNNSLSKSLNPLGNLGSQPAQIAPAPIKAGVSLSDIAATNNKAQAQRAPLISTTQQKTNSNSLSSLIPESKPSSIGDYIVAGAKKLGEYGKKIEDFGTEKPGKKYSTQEKIGGGIIKAVGSFMRSPDDLFNAVGEIGKKVGEGKLSETEGITQSILQTGMTSLGTFYAPVQIGVNSALNATGTADAVAKSIASGRDKSSEFLQKTFDITKDKADSYVDDVYNTAGIGFGALGGKVLSGGLKNIKLAPLKGSAQVGAGVLTQNAPDVILALIGVAADKEGRIPSNDDIAKGLGITTLAGTIQGKKGGEEPKRINLAKEIPETQTLKNQNIIDEAIIDTKKAGKPDIVTSIPKGSIKAYAEFRKNNPTATVDEFLKSPVQSEKSVINNLKQEIQTPDIKEGIKMAKDNIVEMKKVAPSRNKEGKIVGTNVSAKDATISAKEKGFVESTAKISELIPERTKDFQEDTVSKYIKDIKEGNPIEPIIMIGNRARGGSHRLEAFKRAGITDIPVLKKESVVSKQPTLNLPKQIELTIPKVQIKKEKITVDKINQAISQLEKQNENMVKRVKQQPALSKNIRDNVNKIKVLKQELEKKIQVQSKSRPNKVNISDILIQAKEDKPILTPDIKNVETLAEIARQNRRVGLEMRKVIDEQQVKSNTLSDKVQQNRMNEIYNDFIQNRLTQDELSTKIIDDTTLTEQNKQSLINSFADILSQTTPNIIPDKKVKDARYIELLDEITTKDGLPREDMVSKINSDSIIDDKQKTKLIKGLGFNNKEVENILTTPRKELPAFGTAEEAAKIEQDNKDLLTTKKIVENSKLPEGKTEFKLIPLAEKRTSRAINLDTFLSGIKYYIDGKYNGTFQNFIQKSKNTGKRVANQLADDYGVKNILKETTPSEAASVWKNIEKDLDKNLIGGKTQNEGVDITPDNVAQLKDTLKEGGDMSYNETYGDINNKHLNDLAKINFVYELNKGNQQKLDSIIPKNLQEIFQRYDDIYRKAYDTIGPYLVELGQLSKYDIEDQYKRFVMLPGARKALEKITGKSIFTTSDGVEHSTYLDMMTYIKNEKRRGGKDLTPAFDVGNLSSILKQKSTGVDLFRFNSPVIQALDYFRQVGDLTKADSIFKAFDELSQSKDPKVKSFVEGLYNNNGYQNVLEQTMGLGGKEYKSKIAQGIQKTSGLSAKTLLYGSVSNLVQAITSGAVKTAILGNNPFRWTRLLRIKNPETRNIFQKYGIAQEFELSSAKDLAGNKNVALFSGTPIENAQKIAVSLPIMKSTVEKLGTPEQIANIKKGGVDSIAKEFDSIIKASDVSIENQIMDLIYERTNYIGNVSSNARSSIGILNKLGFTALKTFSTNRIGQIQQNILKTISGKEISNIDAMFNEGKFQKLDQITKGRISAAVKIMGPLLASLAVSELYQQANNDNNDEKKKGLLKAQGDQIANQFVGNDYVLIRDYIANLTSSTLNLPADLVKQLGESLMLIYQQKDKALASRLGVEKLISFLLTKTSPGKLINQSTAISTGETAGTKIANFLQVPNLEKQTSKMNAKGFGISTPQEAFAELMGVRNDTATQNYIYGLMQDAKVDEKYKDMPEIAKIFVSWVSDTYNKTARNLDIFALNPYSYQDMGKYNDQLAEENYVGAVLRNRDNNPNLSTFLQKIGIEDSLKNSIIEAKGGNLDQMRNANNQIERVINNEMLTKYIEGENFSDYLNNLEEQNPKGFNNFIGGIALTKKYIDENPELDFSDKSVNQKIKGFFKDSTTNIDAAVSDFSGKAPLSTGLTESLQQGLMQFQDKLGKKGGIDEAKKSLGDIQRIFDIILNNSKHTDGIIAATALKSTELKEILVAMRDKGYTTFDKDFPILTNVIKRGLELRGEVERDNILMDKSQVQRNPTLSSISSGKPITTNGNLSKGTLPLVAAIPQQKNKKLGELIKQKKYQPQQLIGRPDLPNSTSLSEIVKRINSGRSLNQ